jgi:cytochrome P450
MQIPVIARSLGPSEKDEAGFGRMMGNARAMIKSRLERDTDKRSDMLASFVRHGLNADELLSESSLQIIAGSDTTATALRGILLYLLTHSRVYRKLQAEIDGAVRDGVAPPSPGIISDAALKGLPYLHAVIKEGIRIHPPVTDQIPKRVPDEGETVVVDGKSVFLPGGTNISYAAWPLHLSKDIFGDDAEEFRPERWLLEENEKRLAVMNRTHELIFGYGKYQCLGRPVALMEIGKTVFEVRYILLWWKY